MASGRVTEEALSSIESSIKSLGSRTWKTRVSTMSFESRLKEYCTVENMACTANSRRMRTQVATAGSEDVCTFDPGCRNPGGSSRLDFPRSTSKSTPNSGWRGTRARAEAISFCSSAEGEHTFSTFTFTLGGGCEGCCAAANVPRARTIEVARMCRGTGGILAGGTGWKSSTWRGGWFLSQRTHWPMARASGPRAGCKTDGVNLGRAQSVRDRR